ncbi:MAG: sigma-70 family RNA polymerase sigma factor [Clostridia bacterium]|nr:sigma-70 family RNA polymerase sigma factor [Clostridia bacterium]
MEEPRIEQLNRLVLLYEKDMLKLCFVYLRDLEMARDALQESYLKAYRHLDSYQGGASEKTWLTRIVINTCKDFRRSAWFRFNRQAVSTESLPLSVPPPDEAHMDLMAAIMKLPVKHREAILLKYQQGLNNQEIAELLHLTPMAVSKRIRQAYDRLKMDLEGEVPCEK